MPGQRRNVLIVDSDASSVAELSSLVRSQGVEPHAVARAVDAAAVLDKRLFDVVIVDLALPDCAGVAFVADLLARFPDQVVVMMGTTLDPTQAVAAMKAGAEDFLIKPFVPDHVRLVLNDVMAVSDHRTVAPQAVALGTGDLLGAGDAMRKVHETMERVAPSSATILIRGESGTGKELAARSIHRMSDRSDGPFVKIDCTCLPEPLLESELFGYEKGAFTGASVRKPGRVELADGGTLFLDEIGDLGSTLQSKLLRLLQDREFDRIGGSRPVSVDVRFIAATHRDLETMVQGGRFREDLFYRLNVVPVWLPPLRARRDDIETLAVHFCRTFAKNNGRSSAFTRAALDALRKHRWPGNVRQLENLVERLVILSDGDEIDAADVERGLADRERFVTQSGESEKLEKTPGINLAGAPVIVTAAETLRSAEPDRVAPGPAGAAGAVSSDLVELGPALALAEKKALARALERSRGNRTVAARILGISRATLYKKIDEHEIA